MCVCAFYRQDAVVLLLTLNRQQTDCRPHCCASPTSARDRTREREKRCVTKSTGSTELNWETAALYGTTTTETYPTNRPIFSNVFFPYSSSFSFSSSGILKERKERERDIEKKKRILHIEMTLFILFATTVSVCHLIIIMNSGRVL